MLGDEPDLQLIAPNDLADKQVVCPVVTGVGCPPCHSASLLQDNFMGMEQAGNLDGHFLASFWWTRNRCGIGDVGGDRNADAAEKLNTFSNLVDKIVLLLIMLVKQQVQLIERRPCHLPVVLLVQVA